MFEKRHELAKFLVVAETGAILPAAEKLAITQPALSRIISKLEEQFNGQLFERTSTGVRLTELGSLVAGRARHILTEMEIAEGEVKAAISGSTGKLSITVDQVWAQCILPIATSQFHQKYPGVELSLRSATYEEAIQLLTSGDSDLHCGSISVKGSNSPLIMLERILNVTWGVVAHQRHPLHSKQITHEDLVDYPWIEYDGFLQYDSHHYNLPLVSHVMDELYRLTKKRPRAAVRTNLGGLSIMSMDCYLSYLPLPITQLVPGLSLKPLPIELGRREYAAGFVSRRSSKTWTAYQDLQKILRDVAIRTMRVGKKENTEPVVCQANIGTTCAQARRQAGTVAE